MTELTPKSAERSGYVGIQIQRLGVPIDARFKEVVRDRARKLAELYPEIFEAQLVNGQILWMSMENGKDAFDRVYNWVLDGILPEGLLIETDEESTVVPPKGLLDLPSQSA